ncbi:MAG: dTDP-4-dehydrorhamnose reductase [Chloroflexi bacterium]|nr:dTDP-4-dehydrorhamnose reductase [Chloroflexota bacterium]
MRILVTGGRGQLGRALQNALADHETFALGHEELDVTDPVAVRTVFEDVEPDLVVHAAAWTDTGGCEADPQRALAVNAEGARWVAEACRSAGAAMLYVSTNEVFDGEKREPYAEDDRPGPLNAYARSKLEGERAVQAVLDRCYVVRTAWLYGAGRASFPEKIVQAARESGTLKLVTDEIASPTWTNDLARAIARLIREPAPGVYHLTNAGYCSRLDWAKRILELAGMADVPVEPTTQAEFGAPFRKPVFSALANRSAARLGIELRPWEEALADYFAGAAAGLGGQAKRRKGN